MSLFDKLLNLMRLNDEEDDDDEELAYEEYYEEDETPAPKPSRRERKKETLKDRESAKKEKEKEKIKPISKITPIGKSQRKQENQGMQVCVIKPTTIQDEFEIVQTLLSGQTVVINVEGMNVEVAQRIIDFTSGATFAMEGSLQKISTYIFLATPHGVDISGDIQNLMDSFSAESDYTF